MNRPSRMSWTGWRRRWRRCALEPAVETVFHPDSYGYRPGAVAAGRGRGMPSAVLGQGLGCRS